MERVSRAEKRKKKQQQQRTEENNQEQPKQRFILKDIEPITKNQEIVFRDFSIGKNLLIHGLPGTGKSFISLYLALSEIENFKTYKNITIIRSVVPSRDMGFLPGSIVEKSKIYELPYMSICNELYGRGDAYDILKNKKIIDFQTSSFLRGLTLDNSIIIIDECQNMTFQELSTIITRTGSNSRVIFCGDYRQTDLKYSDEKSGIFHFMDILNNMTKYFSCVEFQAEDIVRSGLVKDFIIKKTYLENKKYEKMNVVNVSNSDNKPIQSLYPSY
jgi:phosphate starvation-inducible protein PhoH